MKSTMNALTKASSDTLIAAGEVVELRFRAGSKALSLRSAKLFHLLLKQAGSKACDDIEHRVLISELNFSRIEAGALVECIRDLVGTQVELTYKTPSGDLRVSTGALLSMVDRPLDWREGDASELTFRLSPTLRLILENSNHWARLSRDAVLAFESRYALRLYELISLRTNLRHKAQETFELMDLRRRLGVPDGKLMQWIDFRRKALEAAISEVNQISGFNVSYTVEKRGRRVDRIILSWAYREGGERAQAAIDLAQHEWESVETKEAPPRFRVSFPMHGGLKHGQQVAHWRDLAEKHVKRLQGDHLPDLSVLTDQFRAWCARQSIPLDSLSIEKAFIGFCEKYRPPSAND